MRVFITLVAFAVSAVGWADDPEDIVWQEANSNLASEFASCAAFYVLTANGFTNAERHEAAETYLSMADHSLRMSAALSNEERAQAEMELYRKLMIAEIENDLANLGVLANEHMLVCREALENPDARLMHWVEYFRAELE